MKKKKKTKTEKKTNKNKLNKAMHKIRLTQNMKAKLTSNARKKKQEAEITWSPFPSTPWKNISI